MRIYRQPDTEDVQGCTIIDVQGAGPKRYLRVFDGTNRIEWGWVLHDSAVLIWDGE